MTQHNVSDIKIKKLYDESMPVHNWAKIEKIILGLSILAVAIANYFSGFSWDLIFVFIGTALTSFFIFYIPTNITEGIVKRFINSDEIRRAGYLLRDKQISDDEYADRIKLHSKLSIKLKPRTMHVITETILDDMLYQKYNSLIKSLCARGLIEPNQLLITMKKENLYTFAKTVLSKGIDIENVCCQEENNYHKMIVMVISDQANINFLKLSGKSKEVELINSNEILSLCKTLRDCLNSNGEYNEK